MCGATAMDGGTACRPLCYARCPHHLICHRCYSYAAAAAITSSRCLLPANGDMCCAVLYCTFTAVPAAFLSGYCMFDILVYIPTTENMD
ncbi:hypothetical protein GDO81_009954 [Engystomops pustulosus]|uniref:Uncharacterized protein n=1 Tax=Engystomops pustulosus TaxID=76066 RepID=A0AAV7BWJ2_ENGPU|nr:hypothetical protein GDO81_009954 [Engystomops pustulosus]